MPKKAPRPIRHSTIDEHPRRDDIIRDIVGGKSIRAVGEEYGVSRAAVSRFKNSMHERALVDPKIESELKFLENNHSIIEELSGAMQSSKKMLRACDRFLQDPDDPDEYNLAPRAHEMMVVYTVPGPRGPVKKKATLQDLLDQIHGQEGRNAVEVKYKTADPRKLVLETAEAITRHLDLASKIAAAINESNNRLADEQELGKLREIILKATEKHPEAREAIEHALRRS